MPQTLKKPGYNESQAALLSEKRRAERDLQIPSVFDPIRRKNCESDDEEWLRIYCGDVFYNPFTEHQRKIIADCGEALRYGTSKCKAAPRGDGKSSIVKYLALKYVLSRQVTFPLIVASTSSKAKIALEAIQRRLAQRKACPITQDYPLECHVARYVDPWPSRARNVTANGQRKIHVEWGATHIIIPTWEDEEPLGPIIYSLGITSDDLQGCNIYDRRPDFIMLDDLDSRDSLAAEDGIVAGKIEEAIDKTISGMSGQSRRLGQFMLCTITSRKSAAYKYSDPSQKPAYSGERIPAIIKWPTDAEKWGEYIAIRQAGKREKNEEGRPRDPLGREAHRYYQNNLEAMNAGAELSNPHNYIRDLLPDGTPTHLSSLQRCYDYIADYGMASFLTEHQNDPPEDSGITDSGITPLRIQKQVNGFERGIIPPGCTILTQGIDCHKTKLYWVVRAWRPDGISYHTIDYGTTTVYGTIIGSEEGLDLALIRAIKGRIDETKTDGYVTSEGEVIPISLTLVDAGWRTSAVYQACNEIGLGIMPAMGYGKSAGCVKVSFSNAAPRTDTRYPGDGWFMSRMDDGTWLTAMDADRWKAWEHDRWMTDFGKPGCMYLWGEPSATGSPLSHDERGHEDYAMHVTAETEIEEVVRDVLVRKFKAKRKANHYLDASYMASVAANIKGIRLMRQSPVNEVRRQEKSAPINVHVDLGQSYLASNR